MGSTVWSLCRHLATTALPHVFLLLSSLSDERHAESSAGRQSLALAELVVVRQVQQQGVGVEEDAVGGGGDGGSNLARRLQTQHTSDSTQERGRSSAIITPHQIPCLGAAPHVPQQAHSMRSTASPGMAVAQHRQTSSASTRRHAARHKQRQNNHSHTCRPPRSCAA